MAKSKKIDLTKGGITVSLPEKDAGYMKTHGWKPAPKTKEVKKDG